MKPGGVLLSGLDNGINYLFDESEDRIVYTLPFDPLSDPALFEQSQKNGDGIQFSHTFEEQIGGQLEAGFVLTDVYEDTMEWEIFTITMSPPFGRPGRLRDNASIFPLFFLRKRRFL